MARKPMVTRELIGTEAVALTVNVAEQTTAETTLIVKGRYKTAENLLKALKKQYETDNVKVLKVLSFNETHKLYGMAENEFYSNAIELNPETRKPLSE